MTDAPAILVAGAHGAFGRALVRDLLVNSSCRVLAAGRGRTDLSALTPGLDDSQKRRLAPALCDLSDLRSVASALTNAQAAVCAAGPFQEMPLHLLEVCRQRGIPYFDLADDRGFVRRARALVAPAGPAAGVGWSAAPALSALLARLACEDFDSVGEIQIQIAPGGRSPRGAATVASLCDSLAKPFTMRDGDGWRKALGWSEPRVFAFPKPVGPREGFLIDVADHELLPDLFGAGRVEFRAGAQFRWMNRATSVMAWLSRELAFEWSALAPLLSTGLSLAGVFGSTVGAIGVEVSGFKRGARVKRRATLVAQRGEIIPILPASIMAPQLAAAPASFQGLIPLDRWLSRAELEQECAKRGAALAIEETWA